jgi:hypothetical protein
MTAFAAAMPFFNRRELRLTASNISSFFENYNRTATSLSCAYYACPAILAVFPFIPNFLLVFRDSLLR